MSRRIHNFPAGSVLIRRAEWAVAIAATVGLVGLHLALLLSAGGLWRDEAVCVNVASLPSIKDMWAHLGYESFPILWFAVLRVWLRLGPGTSDFGIRCLGLLVGLGIVAVVWRNARALGHSVPLVSLVLLGFNAAVISYGDAIRGHGLGMLTGLLTFGLVREAAESPTAGRICLALLTALVSLHCLYYNAVLVLAACIGGATVALSRGSFRAAGRILGIGAACAASLLPYAQAIQGVRGEDETRRAEMDLTGIWLKIEESFAITGASTVWIWIALAILAAAMGLWAWRARASLSLPNRDREAALYSGVTLLAGVSAYIALVKTLGYVTQPWYYVALMALVAACLDAPLAVLARTRASRIVRLAVVVFVMALAIRPVWASVRTRKTNVDLIASKVGTLAVKGDLIVVNPWYLGITFDRYYRGAADRITIPPISSEGLHRYDLLKKEMMSRGVMAPVLEGIRRTLAEGHRVFWVGDLFVPEGRQAPAEPPPAPAAPWGWADAPYYELWGLQAGYLIKAHAKAGARQEIPVVQSVSPYEDASLYAFSGWWGGEGPN